MLRIAPFWVLVCILLIPLGGFADGDGREEAKLHFEAGKVLFANEDYNAAAVEFAASTTLYPTQSGYYNLANCYLALHRYGTALETLAALEVRFSDTMSKGIQRKVRKTEITIRKITGEISLKIVPVGARVTVDEREISQVGYENPIVLAPGNYTIDVNHPGYQHKILSVTVLSQKRRQIVVELEPAPLPPVPPIPTPPQLDGADYQKDKATPTAVDLKPYMWVATLSAATTGVAALVFYGLAAHQKNEAKTLASDWQKTYPDAPGEAALETEFEDAASRYRIYRNVAHGLTIGSAIFATGAVLLRYGKRDRESEGFHKAAVSLRPGGVEVRF